MEGGICRHHNAGARGHGKVATSHQAAITDFDGGFRAARLYPEDVARLWIISSRSHGDSVSSADRQSDTWPAWYAMRAMTRTEVPSSNWSAVRESRPRWAERYPDTHRVERSTVCKREVFRSFRVGSERPRGSDCTLPVERRGGSARWRAIAEPYTRCLPHGMINGGAGALELCQALQYYLREK